MIMEVDEVETVLERIWDVHDKLSDAIHSVSRAHFLKSVGSSRGGAKHSPDDDRKVPTVGFVFVKDFLGGLGDDALREAKSLNAVRTALENLDDQLEFFHIHCHLRFMCALGRTTVIYSDLLAMSNHHGKKHKVIEEALAFVGDVGAGSRFISRDCQFRTVNGLSGQSSLLRPGAKCKILIKLVVSSFSLSRKSLGFDYVGGLLGNAALVGITMIAMIHFNNSPKVPLLKTEGGRISDRNRILKQEFPSSSSSGLDVLLARG